MSQAVVVRGEDLRHLRWAGMAMLGAGAVLSRLPVGVGLPCPLRTFTGIPCPFCGMTTSVRETMAGDLAAALAANPAGVALVAAVVVVLVARPRALRLPAVPLPAALLAVMPLLWAFQLHRFGFL